MAFYAELIGKACESDNYIFKMVVDPNSNEDNYNNEEIAVENTDLACVLDPNCNNIKIPQYESIYSAKNANIWDDSLNYQHSFYTCQFCASIHADLESLQKHFELFHFDKYIYKCNFCSTMFVHKVDYNAHMATHKDRFPFQCPRCEESFLEVDAFHQHLAKHDKAICEICSDIPAYEAACQKHSKDESQMKSKLLLCTIDIIEDPVETGSRKSEIINLTPRQADAATMIEPIDIEFLTFNDMELESEDTSPLKIKIISIQDAEYKLVEDFTSQTDNTTTPAKCYSCKKVFNTVEDRDEHMRVHSKNRHTCPICMKNFNHASSVKRHIAKKHDYCIPLPQCQICKTPYKNDTSLFEHFQQVHSNEKLHKCEVCGKSNRNLTTHKRHVNSHNKKPKSKKVECKKEEIDASDMVLDIEF